LVSRFVSTTGFFIYVKPLFLKQLMSSQKIKYPGINGLRAISILFVIIGHLVLKNNVYDKLPSGSLAPFLNFFGNAHMGVNMFFIISGFLITSLLLAEEKKRRSVSVDSFYIRRVLRIFPAYYFLLSVYIILQLFGFIHLNAQSWITSITYTKYFNWTNDWETSHAWSLSIEEQFYLLWPLIFICGDKTRKIFAIVIFFIPPVIRTYVHFHPVSWINDLTIFIRIDAIATGCLLALYKDFILKKLRSHFKLKFLLALICLFFLQYLPGFEISSGLHIGMFVIPFGSTYGTVGNLLMSVIFMYSVFGEHGYWFKFLESRIMNYIGILSYSIYLWQQIFLMNTYWITQFPQNLFFLFLMANISYYIIERPFLKLKTKFQRVRHQ
jgi:peptidoglycan/LPS O-acetylase OafA/YrhL